MGNNSGEFYTVGGFAISYSDGIYIGNETRPNDVGVTNEIVIGYDARGVGSNTVVLGNTSIVKTVLRGTINKANLPTSATRLVAGDLLKNSGIINIM